jgi:cupin 2 domain-containing protein
MMPSRTGEAAMTEIETGRFFKELPAEVPEEVFETLLSADAVRIERIVSFGQASPPGFWYDQEENEWVLLLKGAARLEFEGRAEAVDLRPGDYVNIPAGVRHRVDWTDPDQTTVWLAVWYKSACALL